MLYRFTSTAGLASTGSCRNPLELKLENPEQLEQSKQHPQLVLCLYVLPLNSLESMQSY